MSKILFIYMLSTKFPSVICKQLYYRQKGSRPPTRPEAIHENFELCADVIVAKLQSYFNQADEYHNQCLQGKFISIDEALRGMGTNREGEKVC